MRVSAKMNYSPAFKKAISKSFWIEVSRDVLLTGTDWALVYFESSTRTWKRRIQFETKQKSSMVFEIKTDDEIYGYVSHGTPIRYATMTPNFEAKTQVGSLNSIAGRGGVAFISKKHPRPGIRGRKFDEQIAKREKELQPLIERQVVLNINSL